MNKKTILIIIALIVLVSFGFWVKNFIAIDSCLDRGGRWDYDGGECVENENALEVDKCLNDGGQWDYEQNECIKSGESQ